MALSASTWQVILDAGQFVLTGGVWLYVHLLQKRQVALERIERLEDEITQRLDEHAERISRLETSHVHHGDLEKIHERLSRIDQTLHELRGHLKAHAKVQEEMLKRFLRGET